jgi:hypothetical protein
MSRLAARPTHLDAFVLMVKVACLCAADILLANNTDRTDAPGRQQLDGVQLSLKIPTN